MSIEAKYLRALEFVFCATVGLWLVPQNYMGVYEGPYPQIVAAFSGLAILLTLLIILKNAFYRDVKRVGLIFLAVTITAFGIFNRSYAPLVNAGMDHKLPYVIFSYIQPIIAAFGCFLIWASRTERRSVKDVG